MTAQGAAEWLDPREPVIVVTIGGAARAYSIQILMWHEIDNDTAGGIPITVTFCPLCHVTINFDGHPDGRADGRTLDFGTPGRLRKSDLVMNDGQIKIWGQQFSGRTIGGELVGKHLLRIAASIVAFDDLHKGYRRAEVLSGKTGDRR